jgi:AcrR family transcriptional regulator
VPTQAERTEATRSRLIATARRLFAEKGFAATSTEEILSEASVSRGALYHHFPSKTDLFQATWETVESDLTAKVMNAAASASDPKRMLERGCEEFLDQCRNEEVQRIVMLDGPNVLGWDLWHDLDEQYGLGAIKAVLSLAVEQGIIPATMMEPLAHLLLGAVMQAGMVVARASDPGATKRAMTKTFKRIVDAL